MKQNNDKFLEIMRENQEREIALFKILRDGYYRERNYNRKIFIIRLVVIAVAISALISLLYFITN